ncbi:MAG: diacylglycerol kinase family protein [Solobacterium sp.]|nr:diacylglycerol kinase family protein [Solobacterium sp.]
MKKKFQPAFDGILSALQHRSVRIQFYLGALAILAGAVLKLTYPEWIAFILCIGMVITAELLNTCVEMICNLISSSYDQRIKTIKDIAAGAVLAASVSSLIAAVIILFHHL